MVEAENEAESAAKKMARTPSFHMLRVKIRLYFQVKTLAKEALVLNRSTGREKPVNKGRIINRF